VLTFLVIGYKVNVLQTLIVIIINNLTDLIITINPNFTNCLFLSNKGPLFCKYIEGTVYVNIYNMLVTLETQIMMKCVQQSTNEVYHRSSITSQGFKTPNFVLK